MIHWSIKCYKMYYFNIFHSFCELLDGLVIHSLHTPYSPRPQTVENVVNSKIKILRTDLARLPPTP